MKPVETWDGVTFAPDFGPSAKCLRRSRTAGTRVWDRAQPRQTASPGERWPPPTDGHLRLAAGQRSGMRQDIPPHRNESDRNYYTPCGKSPPSRGLVASTASTGAGRSGCSRASPPLCGEQSATGDLESSSEPPTCFLSDPMSAFVVRLTAVAIFGSPFFSVAATAPAPTPAVATTAAAAPAKPQEICVAPIGQGQPANGPRLHTEARIFDFGTVQRGAVLKHVFELFNYGTAPLQISDVQPACGCTTAGEWTRTIPPGGRGTIPVRFETAQFAGPISKLITVVSNDSVTPQGTLEIKGTIRTPVSLSAPVAIFPAVTDPTRPLSRTITVKHEVDGLLRVELLPTETKVFAAALREKVPGREFDLELTTVPPLGSGTHNARFELKTSNPDMPVVTVQAVVTVLPAVQVAPTEVQLPPSMLTAPEKRYVVVLNHRAGELTVSDLGIDAPGVAISPQRSPDGRQTTVTLTFPAGFDAHLRGALRVRGKTNHASTPEFSVPVVVGGR